MKCPICGNEMEKGYLQAGQRMSWVKKKHKVSLLPKEGEISLGNNVLGGLVFEAYICKDCKKVLLDYSESNYEEG